MIERCHDGLIKEIPAVVKHIGIDEIVDAHYESLVTGKDYLLRVIYF